LLDAREFSGAQNAASGLSPLLRIALTVITGRERCGAVL
jgi:hypothetical protein